MTPAGQRPVRTRVDFRITKLKVERTWMVGGVPTIGLASRSLEEDIARLNPPLPPPAVDYAMTGLEGVGLRRCMRYSAVGEPAPPSD